MKDIQLLIKKSKEGMYEDIFPNTYTDSVFDKLSGMSLTNMLSGFNNYFLSYVGDAANTRLLVPSVLRRAGLWITYVTSDRTIVNECYLSDDISDEAFQANSNWKPLGEGSGSGGGGIDPTLFKVKASATENPTASASAEYKNDTLLFEFGIPRGRDGLNGIDGIDGKDGAKGDSALSSLTVFVFKASMVLPANPIDGSWNLETNVVTYPTGWNPTDDLVGTVWMSYGTFGPEGTLSRDWSTPIRLTGEDGKNGTDGTSIEFIYKLTKTSLEVPTVGLSSSQTGYVPEGWTDHPTGISELYKVEWVSTRNIVNGAWSSFSTPSIWSKWGENGMDGDGVEYVFKRTNTSIPPATPTNDWESGGWSDNPTGVSLVYQWEWVSKRSSVGNIWGDFSTPALWAKYGEQGTAGDSVRTMYAKSADSSTKPAIVPTSLNPGSAWGSIIPEYSGEEAIWGIQGTINYLGQLVGEWAGPYLLTGTSGKDAANADYKIFFFKESINAPAAPTFNDPKNPTNSWVDYPSNSSSNWWMCVGNVIGKTGLISSWGSVVRVTGAQGPNGADGVNGSNGVSMIFKGELTAHPANPLNGWYYRNTVDKKSYVYQDGTWYLMTIDGVDGANGTNGKDGLSMEWKGELQNPPANPKLNWVYRDTDNGIIYIYNGTAWEVLVADGNDGTDGTDGSNGLSVFVTYHDSVSTPAVPTGNGTTGGWHTNSTYAVVWISQKVAANATSGTWGTPIKIKGDNGTDGGTYLFRFKVTDKGVIPTAPNKSEGENPSGWSDIPPAMSDSLDMWMITALFSGGVLSDWSVPVKVSGEKGPQGETGPVGPSGPIGASGLPGITIAVLFSPGTESGITSLSTSIYESNKTKPNWYSNPVTGFTKKVPTPTVANPYIWITLAPLIYDTATSAYQFGSGTTEWSTPIKLSGTNGLNGVDGDSGERGLMVYPAGIYSETITYTTDKTKAPYVLDTLDGNFYVLNFIGSWKGSEQTNKTPSASNAASGNTYWAKFEAFEAVYAKIGIIANGLIGGAVFNGDYMFSQSGTDKSGNASTLYQKFNPDDPHNNEFIPNISLDFNKGTMTVAKGESGIVLSPDGMMIMGGQTYPVQLMLLDSDGTGSIAMTNEGFQILKSEGATSTTTNLTKGCLSTEYTESDGKHVKTLFIGGKNVILSNRVITTIGFGVYEFDVFGVVSGLSNSLFVKMRETGTNNPPFGLKPYLELEGVEASGTLDYYNGSEGKLNMLALAPSSSVTPVPAMGVIHGGIMYAYGDSSVGFSTPEEWFNKYNKFNI